jgi:hypothetical protein
MPMRLLLRLHLAVTGQSLVLVMVPSLVLALRRLLLCSTLAEDMLDLYYCAMGVGDVG